MTDLMHPDADDADDIFKSSPGVEDEPLPTAGPPVGGAPLDAVDDDDDVATAAADDAGAAAADEPAPETFDVWPEGDPSEIFADWQPPAPVESTHRRWTARRVATSAAIGVVLLVVLLGAHGRPDGASRPRRAHATPPGQPAGHHRTMRRKRHRSPTTRRARTAPPRRPRTPRTSRPSLTVRTPSPPKPSAPAPRPTTSHFTDEFTP